MAMDKLKVLSKIPFLVILIAIILVVGFLVTQPEQRTARFWVSMGAMIFASCGMFFTFKVDSARPAPAPARISFWIVGMFYFGVTLCTVLLFGAMIPVSTGTYALILVLELLLFVGMLVILAWFARHAGSLEADARTKRAKIMELVLLVQEGHQSLANSGVEEADGLIAKAKALEEKIRYCDPMTCDEIQDTDAKIASRVEAFRREVKALTPGGDAAGKMASLEREAQDLIDTIERRNKLLATVKPAD